MDCDNPQPTSAGEKTKQLQESLELICKVIMDGDLELSEACDKLNDDDFFYVPAPFKEMTPELEESIKLRLSLDHPHIIKTHDYLIRDTPDEYGWREVVYTEEQMNCVLSRYVWLIKKITYAEKKELVLKVTEGLNYLREQDVFIHELDVCFIYLYNQLQYWNFWVRNGQPKIGLVYYDHPDFNKTEMDSLCYTGMKPKQ